MNSRSFSLKPFKEAEIRPDVPDVKITGAVGRQSNIFTIRYELRGPLSKLMVPAPTEMPTRRDGLWEKTCLEFFLAAKNSDGYWEFNLSPSGDWNVYRFVSYRQGVREEPAFESLPFHVRSEPDILELSLEIGLDEIIPADKALEVAVSAVIKSVHGAVTYWSLHHPGPRPDFHHREGFLIKL